MLWLLLSVVLEGVHATTDTLHKDETLFAPNDQLVANSGNVRLSPQNDENLVIYENDKVLWASNSGSPQGSCHSISSR